MLPKDDPRISAEKILYYLPKDYKSHFSLFLWIIYFAPPLDKLCYIFLPSVFYQTVTSNNTSRVNELALTSDFC